MEGSCTNHPEGHGGHGNTAVVLFTSQRSHSLKWSSIIHNKVEFGIENYTNIFFLTADFVEIKDGAVCHFFSSMVAGFVCTVASVPIDMTKTR